jgi:hypothetical protein
MNSIVDALRKHSLNIAPQARAAKLLLKHLMVKLNIIVDTFPF